MHTVGPPGPSWRTRASCCVTSLAAALMSGGCGQSGDSDQAAIRVAVRHLFAEKGVAGNALELGRIRRQDKNNASLCVTDASGALGQLGPDNSAIVFIASVSGRSRVPGG